MRDFAINKNLDHLNRRETGFPITREGCKLSLVSVVLFPCKFVHLLQKVYAKNKILQGCVKLKIYMYRHYSQKIFFRFWAINSVN